MPYINVSTSAKVNHKEKFLEEIPFYKYRTILKPGISGWAQVNYPYGASLRDSENKLSFDLYYIKHFNIFLDFSSLEPITTLSV